MSPKLPKTAVMVFPETMTGWQFGSSQHTFLQGQVTDHNLGFKFLILLDTWAIDLVLLTLTITFLWALVPRLQTRRGFLKNVEKHPLEGLYYICKHVFDKKNIRFTIQNGKYLK